MRFAPLAAAAAVSIWASAADAQTLAAGAPTDNFQFSNFATGLGQVTDFRFLPDGRTIIVSKTGEVRVRTAAGMVVSAGKFDVDTESEKGLLGVEVHPQFATNKTVFFYYSLSNAAGGTDLDRHHVISMTLKDDNTIDMATLKVLVKDLRGPANHDGGALTLSKDGTKLFIGVGDTGCNKSPADGVPPGNYFGTCLTNGNGKILRINLDGTIPSDNPLNTETAVTACGSGCGDAPTTTGAPRKDIYAWGFRNPWRIWNDPVTDKLWVGDVGEGAWEEIDIVEKGKHYGWPWREGKHGWPVTKCTEIKPNVGNCSEPQHEQAHSGSVKSINGGLILDFCDWPAAFRNLYFFGDNVTGSMWTVQVTAGRDGIVAGSQKDFGSVPAAVSFQSGAGADHSLYVASLGASKIVKFEPKMKETCPTPPPDAGMDSTTTDTGVVDPDGGPVTDSALGDDASVGNDGGNNDTPGTGDEGGCGCSTPGSDAARHGWMALALMMLILRRRR
jgi:MYXO-CTERM domain-containing protein